LLTAAAESAVGWLVETGTIVVDGWLFADEVNWASFPPGIAVLVIHELISE
jgi:hypothetical protein